MKKEKIYISGPVTGTSDYVQKFQKMENFIKRSFSDLDVVNPVRIMSQMPDTTYKQYLKLSLQLLDDCDLLVLLNGSEESKGCLVEVAYAKALGKEVLYEDDLVNCLSRLFSHK